MSRALPKYNKRRVAIIGGAAAVALSGAVIAGTALAGTPAKSSSGNNARTLAASPGTITCPDVASKLPAIPASAQAEVTRNLTLLQTQIDEANKRLVDTVGQGGPNFVNNAILGPLKDKRVATINRIATAIGRTAAKPTGLDSLAPCALNAAGGGNANTGNANTGKANAGNNANAGGKANNGGNANAGGAANTNAGGQAGTGAAGVGTITCPDVASKLPAIPASAQAEVTRNLTLLQTQIDEANKRLVDTVGQGGPNFVNNAILGPLADKRKSTIDRIAIAIGRTSTKPTGLDSLAACTLTK
jgi:F0F1-type ATP synthase membrane subunit b/b'